MADLHSVQQSGHWSITPNTANNRVGPQKGKYAKHLKDILPIRLLWGTLVGEYLFYIE